ILFFVLLLLHTTSADILSDYLANNVDLSVDPCDNFFLHVCSQSDNSTLFPYHEIDQYYRNITKIKFQNDIKNLEDSYNMTIIEFNRTLFQNMIHSRCGDSNACYREEFRYFYE
ncbi:hypothetical protein PMAYCL1PPCAC_01242, partial [Pristionchus mayeri]